MAKTIKYDVDGAAIVWHEIDTTSLKGEQRKAWDAYKAAYAAAKKLQADFETLLRKEANLPEGRRLVVGYNFGKLSVANLVDQGERKSSRAVSLSAALSA